MSINLNTYQSLKQASDGSKSMKQPSVINWGWLHKDIQFSSRHLSMKQKEAFYSEMEVLLTAGLDLKTALELVEEGWSKDNEKQWIAQIRQTVLNGNNLSTALEQTGKCSSYEVFSVQISEESGKMATIFGELAKHFAKNLQYKRLLIGALSYPALVIFVSFLSLLFLLQFLVPLFGDIYTRLDQQLPTITLAIIELSRFVQLYAGYFSILIFCFGAYCYHQKDKMWFRISMAWLLMSMPIFGKLIQKIYLARFAQALAFLLNAKVPLLQALGLVKKMVNFQPIESSINILYEEIQKGKSFYSELQKFPIYPKRMIALVKVGEEANQLEAIFAKLAAQYNDAVEQETKLLGSLIEPVLIVFLAIVVGLVLVSMYLPIFKLVTNFGI